MDTGEDQVKDKKGQQEVKGSKKEEKPQFSKAGMEELEKLEIEERQLRLESLRETVRLQRIRRDSIMRAHATQQRAIEQVNADIVAQQELCKHHKGGKNLDGIMNGHDANYSVVQHTYAHGAREVICTRCGKEWKEPPAALKQSDTAEYKRLLKEWKEALAFPTDNEPSGTQLFIITRTYTQPPAKKNEAKGA